MGYEPLRLANSYISTAAPVPDSRVGLPSTQPVVNNFTSPQSISASVGYGGANRYNDVTVVQELLKKIPESKGGTKSLEVDGKFGIQTIKAIHKFQQTNLGFSDGRIDPGGKTITVLNAFSMDEVLCDPLIWKDNDWSEKGEYILSDAYFDEHTLSLIAGAHLDYLNAKANNNSEGMNAACTVAEIARTTGRKSDPNTTSIDPSHLVRTKERFKERFFLAGDSFIEAAHYATEVLKNLNMRYPEVSKYSNPELLLKDEGPSENELIILYRYWDMANNRNSNLLPVHELEKWRRRTDGKTLEDEYKIETTPTDPIHIQITGNTVNIIVNLKIFGEAADLNPSIGGDTYRKLAASGMSNAWSGKYWFGGRWVYVKMNTIDFNDGQSRLYSGNQKFLDVEIRNKPGRSFMYTDQEIYCPSYEHCYTWGREGWTKKDPGWMKLFIADDDLSTPYRAGEFAGIAGHELTHNLGLGDAYPEGKRKAAPESKTHKDDLMRKSKGVASVVNLKMLLNAWTTGMWQEFPKK